MAQYNPPHLAYSKMLKSLERMRIAREDVEYNAKNGLPMLTVEPRLRAREAEYKEALETWEHVQAWVRAEEWYKAMRQDEQEAQ